MLNCLPVNPKPMYKSSWKNLTGALGLRTPPCTKVCGQRAGPHSMNLAGLAAYRWRTGQVLGKCLVDRQQEGCREILPRHWPEFRRSALSCAHNCASRWGQHFQLGNLGRLCGRGATGIRPVRKVMPCIRVAFEAY